MPLVLEQRDMQTRTCRLLFEYESMQNLFEFVSQVLTPKSSKKSGTWLQSVTVTIIWFTLTLCLPTVPYITFMFLCSHWIGAGLTHSVRTGLRLRAWICFASKCMARCRELQIRVSAPCWRQGGKKSHINSHLVNDFRTTSSEAWEKTCLRISTCCQENETIRLVVTARNTPHILVSLPLSQYFWHLGKDV